MMPRPPRLPLALLLSFLVAACAKDSIRPAEAPRVDVPSPRARTSAAPHHRSRRLAPDAVARAASGYLGYSFRDQSWQAPTEFFSELAGTDVICLGEIHDNAAHHFAELTVLDALLRRSVMSGLSVTLALEAFERLAQPSLDLWIAHRLGFRELLAQSEYTERWGYDVALLHPLLDLARAHRTHVLALGADAELVEDVAHFGLGHLPPEERGSLPALDLDDAEYRRTFFEAMRDHPDVGKPEHVYEAQVVRDETMAERISSQVLQDHVAAQVLVVSGRQHCQRSAIPSRVERREPVSTAAVALLVGSLQTVPDLSGEDFDYAMVLASADQDTP